MIIWQEDINKLLDLKDIDESQIKNIIISSADIVISKNNFYMRKKIIKNIYYRRKFIWDQGLKKLKRNEIDYTAYDMYYETLFKSTAGVIDKVAEENFNYFMFRCQNNAIDFFIDNYNAQYLYNRLKQNKKFYIEYIPVSNIQDVGNINKVLFIMDYDKYKEKRYF